MMMMTTKMMMMMMTTTSTMTKIINLCGIKCDTLLESQDQLDLESKNDGNNKNDDDDDGNNNNNNDKNPKSLQYQVSYLIGIAKFQ